MIISLIAAMGKNREIGKNNQMLWRLPREWDYFKEVTLGHTILTGRKNFEAQGRALPKRVNLVVTTQKNYQAPGAYVFHDFDSAIDFAKKSGETELFICGGGEVYQALLPRAQRLYLTTVDFSDPEAQVFFPHFDETLYEKKLIKHCDISSDNSYPWQAWLYEKK